jgi:rhodanese-related sulfurtransferase
MNARVRSDDRTAWMLLAAIAFAAAVLLPKLFETPAHERVRHVGVEEAEALIAAGAIVVDVRGPTAYGGRHLPGAISVPLERIEDGDLPDALTSAIAKPVVVYCGDGVTMGPTGTQRLNEAGFTQAVNLKPGIQGWAAAGRPVEGPNTKG